MAEITHVPTALVMRISRTAAGAVRIEHGYEAEGTVDAFELWAQVPRGELRMRRVWNELRVLLSIWLERERPATHLEAIVREQVPTP